MQVEKLLMSGMEQGRLFLRSTRYERILTIGTCRSGDLDASPDQAVLARSNRPRQVRDETAAQPVSHRGIVSERIRAATIF